MSLSSFYLDYSRYVAQLRRRRPYAPSSNTASHDNHEKINSGLIPFASHMGMGLRLAALSGRRSSAMNKKTLTLERASKCNGLKKLNVERLTVRFGLTVIYFPC